MRFEMFEKQGCGPTALYNHLHNRNTATTDIQKLRDLHIEMDQSVAAAYGWTDLDLDHGFHETKQGPRFTISESARREVLARLLNLNHERYAAEVQQGLHSDKKARKQNARRSSDLSTVYRSLAITIQSKIIKIMVGPSCDN